MANFDDILFANRNQAYGAFALRQAYRHTLGRALVLGTLVFVGALQLPALYNWVKPDKQEYMRELVLEDVKLEVPPEEKVIVPPKQEIAPVVATVKNLVPDVVADAPEDNSVATIEELQTATSGPTTQEGTGDVEMILAPEAATGPTAIEQAIETPPAKDDAPFLAVEQMPEFPGGQAALLNYLQRTLRYPAAASSANISGRVVVGFIVNADGSLADFQLMKGLGFGTDEEALRVLKAMPKWKPGRQSGRPVRVRFNLPIWFTLE
ncbi:TonB family protein [Fibrella aestuarina]|uniref:TonB family protein n=2 Tax=Fibrivirga algicola TaxID=2950420 RepID=A0ABX0QI00_9BACT|nr:TonB family protein [Fibrivirga algicola]